MDSDLAGLLRSDFSGSCPKTAVILRSNSAHLTDKGCDRAPGNDYIQPSDEKSFSMDSPLAIPCAERQNESQQPYWTEQAHAAIDITAEPLGKLGNLEISPAAASVISRIYKGDGGKASLWAKWLQPRQDAPGHKSAGLRLSKRLASRRFGSSRHGSRRDTQPSQRAFLASSAFSSPNGNKSSRFGSKRIVSWYNTFSESATAVPVSSSIHKEQSCLESDRDDPESAQGLDSGGDDEEAERLRRRSLPEEDIEELHTPLPPGYEKSRSGVTGVMRNANNGYLRTANNTGRSRLTFFGSKQESTQRISLWGSSCVDDPLDEGGANSAGDGSEDVDKQAKQKPPLHPHESNLPCMQTPQQPRLGDVVKLPMVPPTRPPMLIPIPPPHQTSRPNESRHAPPGILHQPRPPLATSPRRNARAGIKAKFAKSTEIQGDLDRSHHSMDSSMSISPQSFSINPTGSRMSSPDRLRQRVAAMRNATQKSAPPVLVLGSIRYSEHDDDEDDSWVTRREDDDDGGK
uniref:Uncharacterized protein n=1 Tax=Chrysotila carterae TaxID=13221 RepID=A0A7S4BYD2_CHRCT|mmetsp:Transcript_7193/g.15918  ORF Transcript_7193/g.15918 Transcript_7193/m.15918 type:complete len:516 (+) Transcript_7193:70-1617(+)|eukprot:2840842-Pleurochrysis_carterae.AAC.2